MVSGCGASVGAHGFRPGGRPRRRAHRPDGLAGEHGLPQRREQRGQNRQERHELHRRLTPLIRDAPHARHDRGRGVTPLRVFVAELCRFACKPEIRPIGLVTSA
jgi:hypothetical protein